jgi:D-alanyl-D-alanine carboxypeptidase/D-alanyl-D-alanine-endopeptidase (penicillin-binding protein 4)
MPPFPRSCFLRGAALALLLFLVPDGAVRAQAPSPPATQRLAQTIQDTLDTPTFSGALWGVHVVNLRTGAVLYSRNADRNFVPASNVKLLTAAAALEQLGPDYRYRTTVYADGPVEAGTLKGNLIVRGAGDPTLGGYEQRSDPTQVFRRWADSLRARGITHIAGNVVGDDSRLDETPLGKGWSWSDISYAYAAQIGGLVFNENTIDLRVRGREVGEPAQVTWEPFHTDYVQIVNRSRTVPFRANEDEEYQRLMGTNTIQVRTRVHPNGIEEESLTIDDPTRYFTHVLRTVLQREGISVDGPPVDLDAAGLSPHYERPSVRRVASYTSPPLSQIVQTMNKESENLYAEQLLRTLAAEVPPATDEDLEPASSPLGVKAVRKTLARAQVDTSRIQLVDGSGLSRQNLLQPRALVRLLQHMWLHSAPEVSSSFYDSLPEGGREGTLEYRFQGSAPARANVRAKTGTLSNVSSLSGYVTSDRGTPVAFSVFCNHHLAEGDQVRSAQDVLVNALARLPL